MKRAWRATMLFGIVAARAIGASPEAGEGRDWTARDSVGVRYFVTRNPKLPPALTPPGWIREALPGDETATFSPDGRHFFFTAFHGDFALDEVVYDLFVFATDEVERAIADGGRRPMPKRTLEFRSGYSGDFESAGIFNPRWESGRTLLFTGVQGRGPHRIHRLDIETGELTALTPERHDVEVSAPYQIGPGFIFYMTKEEADWKPLDAYPRAVIRSNELWQILEPKRYFWRTYLYKGDVPRRVISRQVDTFISGPVVSPDGRWAVAVAAPEDMSFPESWKEYEVPSENGYRFLLIDIEQGVTRQMIDAPVGTSMEVGRGRHVPVSMHWSADSRHVVLYNTALPLDRDRKTRLRMSYIVDYSVTDGKWTILQPMSDAVGGRAGRAEWVKTGTELFVSYEKIPEKGPAGNLYRYSHGRWRQTVLVRDPIDRQPAQPAQTSRLTVNVRQSADSPPEMVATSAEGEVVLTAPDPALEGVWRATSRQVEWPEPDDRTGKGLLYLPRNRESSAPLPLVVQLGRAQPQVFRPDGWTSSGYAMQTLVARGFAVLELEFDITSWQTTGEGKAQVTRIDAAVDYLARSGLVDRNRVGLVGHSRMGYFVYYVATHPGRTRPMAAVVFDSITTSYGEYVIDAGFGSMDSRIYEKQYGEGTFWQNKQGWMDSPAFNVEKVVTPMLFSATGDTNSVSLLETAGAFRLNERPAEFHYYRTASHNLQRPKEREAAMQSTVDWMEFWILGRKPAARADDPDRPARWERMRSAWVETQKRMAAVAAASR